MKLGIIGYRGMVGRIFLNRFKKKLKNNNFFLFGKKKKKPNFFLENDYEKIFKCKILIICKNESFSKKIYKICKKKKWKGYIIDSSSYFRRKKYSTICLNPINNKYIIKNIKKKKKIFCGGNCTVSLMMIALKNFFLKNLIKNIFCTTFQSISGAGYNYFNSIIKDYKNIFYKKKPSFKKLNEFLINNKNNKSFSITPWIGNSKEEPDEEIKGNFETNIILKSIKKKKVNVFSNCVRVNSIRCHSQSIFVKTNFSIKKKKIIKYFSTNKYIKVIKNMKMDTEKYLNPNFVLGKKKIFVGRIKKISKKKFSFFTIGDQLIWGASEPLFKTLECILKKKKRDH
ncbi:aspartate-semialdehyde dehydrogenase [Candidatus Vidania fulgoroideorum]